MTGRRRRERIVAREERSNELRETRRLSRARRPGHAGAIWGNEHLRHGLRRRARAIKTEPVASASGGTQLFGTVATSFIKPGGGGGGARRAGADAASNVPPTTYASQFANSLDDSDELEAAMMTTAPPPPRNTYRAPPPPPVEVPVSPKPANASKATNSPSPGRPPRSPKAQTRQAAAKVGSGQPKRATARTGPTGAAAKVGSIVNRAFGVDDGDDSLNASEYVDQMEQEKSLNASDSFDF